MNFWSKSTKKFWAIIQNETIVKKKFLCNIFRENNFLKRQKKFWAIIQNETIEKKNVHAIFFEKIIFYRANFRAKMTKKNFWQLSENKQQQKIFEARERGKNRKREKQYLTFTSQFVSPCAFLNDTGYKKFSWMTVPFCLLRVNFAKHISFEQMPRNRPNANDSIISAMLLSCNSSEVSALCNSETIVNYGGESWKHDCKSPSLTTAIVLFPLRTGVDESHL